MHLSTLCGVLKAEVAFARTRLGVGQREGKLWSTSPRPRSGRPA